MRAQDPESFLFQRFCAIWTNQKGNVPTSFDKTGSEIPSDRASAYDKNLEAQIRLDAECVIVLAPRSKLENHLLNRKKARRKRSRSTVGISVQNATLNRII